MQEQIINILADATGRDTADFSDASQILKLVLERQKHLVNQEEG